jgi:hypothetical protein
VFARLEPRFDAAKLFLAHRVRITCRCGRLALARGRRCRPEQVGGLRLDRPGASLERTGFGLELDPPGSELLLDPPRLLLPFVEARALGGRKLPFRLRGAALRVRAGERSLELLLALGELRRLGFELCVPRLQLPLARVEGLPPLERSTLACDERVARGGLLAVLPPLLLHGLAAVEPALKLGELAFARRHRFGALAERLLQLLELGPRLLLVRMPLLCELAREAKQRRLVPVDAGDLGRAAAGTRRPAVEALFPAVYAGFFRQQTLIMYGSPASFVRQVIQSISTGPSVRSTCKEPMCTAPSWTVEK